MKTQLTTLVGEFICGALLFLVLSGCGSSRPRSLGTEVVVEKSVPSTPAWTNQLSVDPSNEDRYFYATGTMTRVFDKSYGMSQAQAEAVRQVLNALTNKVKSSTTQALEGANMSPSDVGRYSQFAVAWISETPWVSGFVTPESYWEKVERTGELGVEYFYNCYVRGRLSREDFLKAANGAYAAMLRQAQEERNRKAEEVAKELIKELRGAD